MFKLIKFILSFILLLIQPQRKMKFGNDFLLNSSVSTLVHGSFTTSLFSTPRSIYTKREQKMLWLLRTLCDATWHRHAASCEFTTASVRHRRRPNGGIDDDQWAKRGKTWSAQADSASMNVLPREAARFCFTHYGVDVQAHKLQATSKGVCTLRPIRICSEPENILI